MRRGSQEEREEILLKVPGKIHSDRAEGAKLDVIEAIDSDVMLDTSESRRRVPGIDIDIRAHDRQAVEAHPMASRIQMLQGSSTDPTVVEQVRAIAARHSRVLIYLDSNHTHEHGLAELRACAQLTSVGSYCVVFDTVVEDMQLEFCVGRPWGKDNSPYSAATEYLRSHPEFVIDKSIHQRWQITVAVDGYLKRVA